MYPVPASSIDPNRPMKDMSERMAGGGRTDLRPLTPAEVNTVRLYTNRNSGYGDINGYLRTGQDNDLPKPQSTEESVKLLDSALRYCPPVSRGDYTVSLYRSFLGASAGDLDKLKVGDVIKDPAYVSTSISREAVEKWGAKDPTAQVVKIADPRSGVTGLYIPKVLGSTATFPEEKEMLLPRNLLFIYGGKDSTGTPTFTAALDTRR
jgi:hypothetical protein